MSLRIRYYKPSDEDNWIRCYLLSYIESAYYDELVKVKPRYENQAIELIGLEGNEIVGILDIEIEEEPGQLCLDENNRSGIVSIIGVIPEYRRRGVGTKLIKKSLKIIQDRYDINRLEIWARDDPSILGWLNNLGFKKVQCYYEVLLRSDFFDKFRINLPFGITPSFLNGIVDSGGFYELKRLHPPERTYQISILEKFF